MEIIEGRNPLIEALKAGRPVSKILLDSNIRKHGAVELILNLSKARGVPVEFVDRRIMEKQSSTGSNQGVIAYAEVKEFVDLSELINISRIKPDKPLYLLLDGIEDPHNLGAILRTAEATGVHGVIVRERRAAGITPAVIKASAGAVEYVNIARVANISQAVVTLKKNGIWVTGIDMNGQADYRTMDFTLPSAIVIGGEGQGLSDLVRRRCDWVASIPMKGKIMSLNASVAAAVVMYEALRQREGPLPR
ncbi:MAG: 23S rRNA (guanosine(2251)-2'-O)-methyltransferase RlmB [Dehalococcoidia bacterium]|nr:23S rRNA (guanosine(2251)-2'-O)-methyltransferase RlmB [Dehalococcoidia bacterium]